MTRVLLQGGPPSLNGATHTVRDGAECARLASYRYWPTGTIDHASGLPIWRENRRPLTPWPNPKREECWTNV